MGVLGTLMHKKKMPDFQLPSRDEVTSSPPGISRFSASEDFRPSFTPSSPDRSTDLILAKLDLISQRLQSLDDRMQAIEKIARDSQ